MKWSLREWYSMNVGVYGCKCPCIPLINRPLPLLMTWGSSSLLHFISLASPWCMIRSFFFLTFLPIHKSQNLHLMLLSKLRCPDLYNTWIRLPTENFCAFHMSLAIVSALCRIQLNDLCIWTCMYKWFWKLYWPTLCLCCAINYTMHRFLVQVCKYTLILKQCFVVVQFTTSLESVFSVALFRTAQTCYIFMLIIDFI